MKLRFKKLLEGAKLPVKKPGNIGIDLHCIITSPFATGFSEEGPELTIPPNSRRTFSTGLAVDIPEGYGIVFKDRSGMAAKFGIHVLAGVIDSSYTGELLVCLLNTTESPYVVKDGDKICQMILLPDYATEIEEVETLKATDRGDKGFGSSGR